MKLFSVQSPHKKIFGRKPIIPIFIITLSFSVLVSNVLGAQIKLAWDAVSDSHLAGYRLHYGTSSGRYTNSVDAGQNTTCTVPNLASGTTYFFAVTAYTLDSSESGYSNEVSYTVPVAVSLSSITIGGPIQVSENSSTQYTCTAHYSDGSSVILTSGVSWSENAAAATITSNGRLSTGSVTSDTLVSVTAAYKGQSDTHSVTIKKTAAALTSLSISGPARIDEESSGQYECTARYSDNSTSLVTDSVQWNVNSEFAAINATGHLVARAVKSDEHVTITATFDGKQAAYDLIIADSKTNYTLNIHVIGSGTVLLDPPGGIYDDGTTVTLTAEADQAWAFDGWMGSVADTEASSTVVVMDSDIDLSATFLGDTDLDSVPDQEEWGSDSQDMNFDGNDDGIADYLQGSVTSLHTKDYQHFITLSTLAPARFTKCRPLETDQLAGEPEDFTFPLGLLAIRIEDLPPGAGTTLTMHLPAGSKFDTFYKNGPTLGESSAHWYEFKYDQSSETGAIIDSDTITIFLKDGSRGDDDLIANGVISDPCGPAIVGSDPTQPGQQLSDGNPVNASPSGSNGCFIHTIFVMSPH